MGRNKHRSRMGLRNPQARVTALGGAALCFFVFSAQADIDPVSGIDMVTIGAAGNAPWPGNGMPPHRADGRGAVNYEYRIGRYEVASGQWVEFFNAALDRPVGDTLPHVLAPTFWGGIPTTPNNPGNPNARRFTTTPQSAALPAGNISWRMAAMYCNWLHNGKAANREAFLSGAYDVSTFTYNIDGTFNDQLIRSPGARYFIPSWDEWLKAAHYDPTKQNPDGTTGGWWLYSNSSDQPFIAGPPGVGTANFGWDEFDYPGQSPFAVPLGAYTGVTSPWGLYDVAGAAAEWTEEPRFRIDIPDFPSDRFYDGSYWTGSAALVDQVNQLSGGAFPSLSTYDLGFRIAASIPSPAGWGVALGLALITTVRRRRSNDQIRAGDGSGACRGDGGNPGPSDVQP